MTKFRVILEGGPNGLSKAVTVTAASAYDAMAIAHRKYQPNGWYVVDVLVCGRRTSGPNGRNEMTTITSKIEFDNLSATLCGRMVSLDAATRQQAAAEAETLAADLPKFLRNSPHCAGEIDALNTLVARVRAA